MDMDSQVAALFKMYARQGQQQKQIRFLAFGVEYAYTSICRADRGTPYWLCKCIELVS
jgi:hypothetical protein